jgi:3-hydroxyacyl-CoA dehydrogenase / enoyl-CoA hydratase / 3-hydroxybutyryl-CoA epimerase
MSTTTATDTATPIRWEQEDDGVVILTLDDPSSSANTMTEEFRAALRASIERIAAEKDSITGVVVRSAKKTFFAGGNLDNMLAITRDTVGEFRESVEDMKSALRALETSGKPVVSLIAGAALGGGFEIALSTHHRIVLDSPRAIVGLPEVNFSLLPGGGGVVRTVRLLGLRTALEKVLLDGKSFAPAKALELGLVDEVVATEDELLPAAKAWIAAHPDAVQPWDVKGAKIPGETADQIAGILTAQVMARVKGANYPAYRAILATAVESTRVAFDAALEIETRYFLELIVNPVSKNMIKSNFFDLRTVRSGAARPDVPPSKKVETLDVIGAGMMGAGLAYQGALKGMQVRLLDVSIEAAEKGKDYARKLVGKNVAAGRQTQEEGDALLERITTVTADEQLEGADAVIEAIAENTELKQKVFGRIEPHLPGALLASNTSSLPITILAEGVQHPELFVGMHFFSPVDRMELLEIVVGEKTSPETVAWAFDLGLQLGKTPIIVNDFRGFFTSRTISARMYEALAMLGEGVNARSLERASTQAGYAVGILQFLDEVTITLPRKVLEEAQAATEAAGGVWQPHPAEKVLVKLIDDYGRGSRISGAGFYDYADGKRTDLWPGLAEHFEREDANVPFEDMKERMLFAEGIELAKCFDEGVFSSLPDANVGSLLGIAFPAWTGGLAQFIANYDGGVEGFIARANELADQYGERFRPPASLTTFIVPASAA